VLLPILIYNLLQHLAAGVVDRLLLALKPRVSPSHLPVE
jgi:hypothetical protein